jgi:hypothetical protein
MLQAPRLFKSSVFHSANRPVRSALTLMAVMASLLGVAIEAVPARANEVQIQQGSATIRVGQPYFSNTVRTGGISSSGISTSSPSTVIIREEYYRPRYGQVFRGDIEDSTLINPVIIDSRIDDSTLINPVIVDSPAYGGRTVVREPIIIRSTGRSAGSSCRLMSEVRAACQ